MTPRGPKGKPAGMPILDAIAELAFGTTVVFDRPLPTHARALMDTLGVNVVFARPASGFPTSIEGEKTAGRRLRAVPS